MHFDGSDESLSAAAQKAVEPVWAIVGELFGAPLKMPTEPLGIHLYREVAGYQAAELRLTQGRFAQNLAFAHMDSRTAHVALQPPCTDETLKRVGLPAQTRTLLAWEAAHLARIAQTSNHADHPAWVVDGLAGHVAARVMRAEGHRLEALPYWASKMKRVQALAIAGRLPTVEAILLGETDDLNERYALRHQWFEFLAQGERRQALLRFLAEARRLGGGPGYAKAVHKLSMEAFGDSGPEFQKHIAAQKPEWDEVYRSLAPEGQGLLQIAFPTHNAIAWNQSPVLGARFSMKAKLEILPGGREQVNFLFARESRGFYSIAFVAGRGFNVFDYDSRRNSWTSLYFAAAPALRLGAVVNLRLEGLQNRLTVSIDDQNWTIPLPVPLPDRVIWGLGCQAGPTDSTTGSAAKWENLIVSP